MRAAPGPQGGIWTSTSPPCALFPAFECAIACWIGGYPRNQREPGGHQCEPEFPAAPTFIEVGNNT